MSVSSFDYVDPKVVLKNTAEFLASPCPKKVWTPWSDLKWSSLSVGIQPLPEQVVGDVPIRLPSRS